MHIAQLFAGNDETYTVVSFWVQINASSTGQVTLDIQVIMPCHFL